MKKILYIDSHSTTGHVNFNKIYLREIEKNDVEIHTVFRKNFFDTTPFFKTKTLLNLPNFLYVDRNLGNFFNRVFLCFQLLYVRINVNFSNYDYVILSSYDEFALFFSGIRSKMYLINHHNARGFESSIKRFFLKKISKYHDHIVFTDEMKQVFIQNNIHNVLQIPHGLVNPNVIEKIDNESIISNIDSRLSAKEFDYVLFSPSGLSDIDELELLINNDKFVDYIRKNKILWVLKNKIEISNEKNILTLKRYLTAEEYRALFNFCDVIVICYPKTFKYRVSGVLFECFANKKRSFVFEIPSFMVFKNYFNYNPYFKTADELIDRIENMIASKDTECYNDLSSLQPKFDFLNH